MFQTLLSKLPYPLILLLTFFITAQLSYAKAAANGVTKSAVAAADDDDDKRRGRQGRGDKGRKSQRDNDREGRSGQRRSDDNSRRQQRESDRNSRRQQEISDRNSRRQQQWSDRNSRRQQEASDRNSRRQQQQWEQARRQQWENARRASRRDDDDDDRRGNSRQRGRSDRRVIYVSPQRDVWSQVLNRRNDFARDQQRYAREQRKYQKEQQKAARRYDRDQRRYYNNQVYNQNYYGGSQPVYQYNNGYDGGGSDWKGLILRNIISNVLGGGGGFDLGSIIPSQRYTQAAPYNYGYSQPSYQAYSPAPVNYDYYDQGYYGQPDSNSLSGGDLLGSLPIAEIIQQYTGDNEFISSIVGGLLSQGYDQGYLAGQTARQYDYDDASYNDPYAYSDGSCDLHSATLADNRRYLSQGYELGYQDALNGQAGYNPQTEGNVDLVGALLNNVLSGI